MPRIAMLEGYGGGKGFGLMCGEIDVALARLKDAVEEADRVGVNKDDPRYKAAVFFIEQEDSFWTGSAVLLPWQCTRVTSEANGLITSLNSLISIAGGVTVAPVIPNEGPGGYFTPVLVWGSVIAAVVVLGPPIMSAIAASKARPKLSFVEGRRRRKKRRS